MSIPRPRAAGILVTAIVVAIGMVTFVLPGHTEPTLRVGKAVRVAFSEAPADIGVQYGLFEKNGVHVVLSGFGGGGALVQAMAGGSIDIGLTASPELSLIKKGGPFQGVAVIGRNPSDLCIMVRTDRGIDNVADLKGKKLAVSGIHSLTSWLTTNLSILQGWGPGGIAQVYQNSPSEHVASMVRGETDGLVTSTQIGYQLEKDKRARLLVNFGDYIPELATDVIIASNDIIAKDPEAVRAFLKGWLATIAFVYAERDKTVAVFAKASEQPLDVTVKAYDDAVKAGFFSRTGKFDAKLIAPLPDAYVAMDFLKEPPDMKSLYTEKFLPD